MVVGKQIADFLIEEAVRQIKMRPYLSTWNIPDETRLNWINLVASASLNRESSLTRLEFNSKDYKLDKKNRVLSLYLRGIIQGQRVEEYYQKLAKMGDNERRYFGRFSSEYEFDSIIQNEFVRKLIIESSEACAYSLFYRLNDYNPSITGSGHRKVRPLLTCLGATDEEIKKLMKIEQEATKKWGYSDYGK